MIRRKCSREKHRTEGMTRKRGRHKKAQAEMGRTDGAETLGPTRRTLSRKKLAWSKGEGRSRGHSV